MSSKAHSEPTGRGMTELPLKLEKSSDGIFTVFSKPFTFIIKQQLRWCTHNEKHINTYAAVNTLTHIYIYWTFQKYSHVYVEDYRVTLK